MQSTLVQEVWPLARDSRLAQAVLVVTGTLLLALSAKVQVPFFPVPATMQTYAVLLLGIAYGPRLGVATGALYLIEGALSLPVFASGGGVQYLTGPTAGYLFGFILAMGVTGLLAERGWSRSLPGLLAIILAGEILIFVPGVIWLGLVTGSGIEKAIDLGLTPFILVETFKAGLVVVTIPLAWRFSSR
ncbi:MAG TPA: hypothetical protein DHW07_03365 [Gammaproteobacteria bacterium]|nr:hypothetical protein [Gammaproteobacteria bacterium]|tara:strand:+ start:420 stop:983 length:564 start_codon:yes stop_codon:yes gene_type:complete